MAREQLLEMKDRLFEKYKNNPAFISDLENVMGCINERISQTTCGEYKTEKDAETAFDSSINKEYFINEKEVVGRRLFDDKPTDQDGQRVRIDRVLHPTLKAVEAGWIYGPIAVEIKKSSMAFGPILTQTLEYRQSVFLSKVLNNTRILPLVFAVFPSSNITNDLHSLQSSQIILSCNIDRNRLRFGLSGINAIDISATGITIGGFIPTTKKGHRGREK